MSSHVHSQTGTFADLARVGWDSEWAPEKTDEKSNHRKRTGRHIRRVYRAAGGIACSRRRRRAVKRLVRNATETPLAQGLALERNLFLRLCISEPALARMRFYEAMKITAPSRSTEVETGSES
jgi:hypothetical protein